MSLHVIQDPNSISFSKNPINYKFVVDDLYEGDNIYPWMTRGITRYSKQGEGFGFDFKNPSTGEDLSVFFQAVPNPDDSGNQYWDDTFVGFTPDYLQSLIEKMRLNELFTSYYSVEITGSTQITITAKQPVEELILNYHHLFITPGIPTTNVAHSDIFFKKTKREGYAVNISVLFEKDFMSGEFDTVAELKEYPNDNSELEFDISKIIDAEIEASFDEPPLPNLHDNNVYKNNLVRRYFLTYNIYWNGNLNYTYSLPLPKKLVHFGGVSTDDFSENDIINHLVGTKKFLSSSNNKKLHPEQKDWLSFINIKKEDDFEVFVDLYYTDGTSSLDNSIDIITLSYGETLTTPVGFEQLDLQTIAGTKIVYKWIVKVKDSLSNIASELKTFYTDTSLYQCIKTIAFLNSFGCPETFLTNGEWTESFNIKKSNGTKTLINKYKSINGQAFTFNQFTSKSYKARTGYLDQESAIYIKDVMGSEMMYIIEDFYRPIYAKNNKIEIKTCLKFLHQIEFDIVKSTSTGKYTKIEKLPIINQQYSCGLIGFGIDDKFNVIDAFGDLKIFLDNTIIDTVSYSVASNSFILTTPLTKDDKYSYELSYTLKNGQNITINRDFSLIINKSFFISGIATLFNGDIKSINGPEKLYINWGEGLGDQLYNLSDSVLTSINYAWTSNGYRLIQFYAGCPNNIASFNSYNNKVKKFDFNAFKNLYHIRIYGAIYFDNIDINLSVFSKLSEIFIEYSSYESIQLGVYPNLQYLYLRSNNYNTQMIEDIFVKIWTYRKIYDINLTKYINVTGNPGAGLNISSKTLDIINGTGLYSGEGLQSDYNFLIFT